MISGFAITCNSSQLHLGSACRYARGVCRPGNLRSGPSLIASFSSAQWQELEPYFVPCLLSFAADCIRTTNPYFTNPATGMDHCSRRKGCTSLPWLPLLPDDRIHAIDHCLIHTFQLRDIASRLRKMNKLSTDRIHSMTMCSH